MMKKIFSIILTLISLNSFSQYIVNQSLGSDSTLVTSKGALKSRLINKPYADTTAANSERIKYYDGAQIYTNSGSGKFWIRDSANNRWLQLATSSGVGTVTQVNTGYGLTGGPITTVGTIVWDSATASLKYVRIVDTAAMLANYQHTGNYITALTGDATATGPGSAALTLANTAVTPGSYTNTNLTVDSKGRITAASNGSASVTPAALTKTDDTNVTLTLGGTPTTALLQATSLTLGWAGNLAATRGGTGTGTVTTGDLLYGSASNVWSKRAIGTDGQHMIVSGGLPVWRDSAALTSYFFSGQRENDLLKYDSVNNRWVNFRLNVNAPLAYDYVTNTLSADTTTAITGLATKAYVLNNAGGGGSGWALTGNAGINAGTNFLGTTDAKSLRFRVNNNPVIMIDSSNSATYIGTTNRAMPSKLKVVSTNSGSTFTNAIFKAYATDSAGIWMNYDSTNKIGYISATKEGVSNDPLILNLAGGNVSIGTSTVTTEKLRINGAVRLGTGTSSPAVGGDLKIVNAGQTTLDLYNSTTGTEFYMLQGSNGDITGTAMGNHTNQDWGFRTNALTRMMIKNSGYIGIGGAAALNPTATLQLKQGSEVASNAPLKYTFVSLATTGASGTGAGGGNLITITFAAQTVAPFVVGSKVTIAGVTPSGYNGSYTVQSCTTTQVVCTLNGTTGSQTVAGTVTQGNALLTTPEVGAKEFDGHNEYITDSTASRYLEFKGLTGSATLDFGSTGAGAIADLTITVTGAADGDAVILGVPNGSVTATATYTAWVSSANTVTVRFSPKATEDPASGTFKVKVIKD